LLRPLSHSSWCAAARLHNAPRADLKDLAAHVAALQAKPDEPVEVFGLKIPSGTISAWGFVLLLAIQSYFWIHLNEFSNRADLTTPGIEVAWIGVYRSRAARLAVMLSACVLPAVALLLLYYDANGLFAERIRGGLADAAAMLGSTLGLLIGGGLAIPTSERLIAIGRLVSSQPSTETPGGQALSQISPDGR
jgi:hypothetical protein